MRDIEKCGEDEKQLKKTNLPLRFMGRTLTATFTFVSDIFLSTCVAHPVQAPSYLCTVRESPTRSPEFGHKKRGPPSLNHRQSPDPEDERRSGVHFSCFISTQFRLLCESSALLQPQTASPPPPSSTGSTTASLWLTGDGGAADGQPVCAPPRRLLGKEKAAEGKRDAG